MFFCFFFLFFSIITEVRLSKVCLNGPLSFCLCFVFVSFSLFLFCGKSSSDISSQPLHPGKRLFDDKQPASDDDDVELNILGCRVDIY